MMKTNSKKILIIFSVIFLLLAIFNVFWFHFIKAESQKVLELKKQLETETSSNQTVSNLKKDIRELEEKEKQIDQIFIDENNIVVFIEKIERIAEQSGVGLQIQNVDVNSIKNDDEKKLYGVVNMILSVNGGWAEVTTFLKMLETMPNSIAIGSLTLTTIRDEVGSGWSANFSLTGISQ